MRPGGSGAFGFSSVSGTSPASCSRLRAPFSAVSRKMFSSAKCAVFLADSSRPPAQAPSLCLQTMGDSQTPGGVGWGAGGYFLPDRSPDRLGPQLRDSEGGLSGAWRPSPSEKSR
ncbi:unnamed protein product [Rangifer tarandus platyrhynchus]|uniref:Uncharacterized protein n=2 Tax=Rangifer tarandus platyrhynchus TaxID=3082113 RepID=A0ABN8YTD6_RANTA|nr:unnamed protein product [Rangifer tarandus platyrhynchus]